MKRPYPHTRAIAEKTGYKLEINEFGLSQREMLYIMHLLGGLAGPDAAAAAGYGGDVYKRSRQLQQRPKIQEMLIRFKSNHRLGDEKFLIPETKEGITQFMREIASGVRRVGTVQLQALINYGGILGVNFEAATTDKGKGDLQALITVMRAGPVPGPEDEKCGMCGQLVTAERDHFNAERKAKATQEKRAMQ